MWNNDVTHSSSLLNIFLFFFLSCLLSLLLVVVSFCVYTVQTKRKLTILPHKHILKVARAHLPTAKKKNKIASHCLFAHFNVFRGLTLCRKWRSYVVIWMRMRVLCQNNIVIIMLFPFSLFAYSFSQFSSFFAFHPITFDWPWNSNAMYIHFICEPTASQLKRIYFSKMDPLNELWIYFLSFFCEILSMETCKRWQKKNEKS